jgi:hypothetical protein
VYDTVVLNAVPDETAERLTVDEMKTLENEQSIRIEAEIQKKKQGSSASSATVNPFTTQTTGVNPFTSENNSFLKLGNDAFSAEEKMELPF